MSDDLRCWKCGASLEDFPRPLGRRALCPDCGAELHTCRQCRHHDPAKAKQCRELAADEVREKTRANFCEWFQPGTSRAGSGGAVRTALDDLFVGGPAAGKADADNARAKLEKLFGND